MAAVVIASDNRTMGDTRRTEYLQAGAAALTWLLVTGLALFLLVKHQGYVDEIPVFLALAVVNLAATLYACRDRAPLVFRQIVHAVGLVSAFAMGWVLHVDFFPIYTIVWMAVATDVYPERALWALLGGIIAGWWVIMRYVWGEDDGLITAVLYGTFHLFALLTARNAAEAAAARDRAEFLNRELVASQHLLSEASRQSERTRIARDLHDLLGHHLTALSINLQVAEHLAEGKAEEKIAESRALARLLLSDVRDAVSTLRDESAVDFDRAIRLLVEKVPQLDIDLDIETGLEISQFEVAESLLRCVQEALTNTLRHSGANRSWIRVWRAKEGVHLEIRDNGRSSGKLVEGNGLTGLRERLEHLQGSLELDRAGQALRLHVMIPVPA